MSHSPRRILIFDENRLRASVLEEGLRAAGIEQILVVSDTTGLAERIVTFDPDVIFLDLQSPQRDMLESMLQVSRAIGRPTAVFVDEADAGSIEAAMDAGVSAYIVDGLKKERVKAILDVTISRFNAFNRLKAELDAVKTELAERKIIDKAKILLMKKRGLAEDAAYALMRRTAMSQSCRIVDVARSILMAADLLTEGGE